MDTELVANIGLTSVVMGILCILMVKIFDDPPTWFKAMVIGIFFISSVVLVVTLLMLIWS